MSRLAQRVGAMCREQKHRDAFLLALRRELDEAAKRNQASRLLALLPKRLIRIRGVDDRGSFARPQCSVAPATSVWTSSRKAG